MNHSADSGVTCTEAPAAPLFVLSTADCSGPRATRLLAGSGSNDVSRALHGPNGVPIGRLFSAISQLYFRGKLTYAEHFAPVRADGPAIRIVTPTLGLVAPALSVGPQLLSDFARGSIDVRDETYLLPLLSTARAEARLLGAGPVVFLGSIATPKYVGPLRDVFGEALKVPRAFVGLGNMQRGSILLNAVEDGRELEYISTEGQD